MCICDLENTTLSNYPSNDDDTCIYKLDPDQENIRCILQNCLEIEGRLVVCFLGLIFNVLVIIILLDRKLKNELHNRLLLCLVVMDSLYLLVGTVDAWIFWLGRDNDRSFNHEYLKYFIIKPVNGITKVSIIYLTVILALQRYITITKPLDQLVRDHHTNNATWRKTLKFTLPIIFLSIVYMIPEFFEFSIEQNELGKGIQSSEMNRPVLFERIEYDGTTNISTKIVVTDLRLSVTYELAYRTVVNTIITGLIPLSMLAYFNIYIYQGMKRFLRRRWERRNPERDRDAQTRFNNEIQNQLNQTIILFAIVFLFIVTNVLRIALNISDLISHDTTIKEREKNCYQHPYWYMISVPISQILMDVNSSVNLFIYCAFNNSFRSVINDHVCWVFDGCLTLSRCNQRSRQQRQVDSERELETLNRTTLNQQDE